MKLPRYTATTPPPRETGLARAQDIGALTRTGDVAVWRGVSQLGGAIQKGAELGYQAYMNRQALDDQTTMGEISKRATDADTEAINTIKMFDPSVGDALPDNPKEYYDGTKLNKFDNPQKEVFIDTTYKDYEAKILSLAKGIKNPETRQAWINAQLPDAYKRITGEANLKHQEYQETLILGNARTAATNGDMETANQWVDIAEKYGLIGSKRAVAERESNTENYIVGLYRTGLHKEARKVLESSTLSAKEKEILSDEIDIDERTKIVEFENGINNELVRIDNTEGMTQADFNEEYKGLKNQILVANIPGTQKKKMLSNLEKWRRGTNEIDYAKILSLNQEMDAAQRSGIVDPTIQTRIMRASLEGSFGGRNKGGQKTYGDMIRRFGKLQFDERIQATSSIVRTFERENADDPRLIFLFYQAKNKLISDNPDADTKELFIKISGLAEAYSVLPESVIELKLRTKTKETVIMTSPEGIKYAVPISKKQKFIDNGYIE